MTFNIESINNKHLFFYIAFIIITITVFSKMNIKLNIVYGTAIGCIVLWYYNQNHELNKKSYDAIINNKIESLRPKPKNTIKYEEMTNYLFSIQDLYIYNPQAFELLVLYIDTFFDCYEETQLDASVAGERYDDMRLHKRDALNALHSIIHKLPSSESIMEKLNKAINQLDELLNVYMVKVERTHDLFIHDNGYSVNTKIINKGWFAKNLYDIENNIHYYEFI
jgi:hypothetical protein